MKNILLPTDFSENSINAINYALKLFATSEIKFHILNVQKTSDFITSELMTSSTSDSVYKGVLDDNKIHLENLVKKLKVENSSEKFTFKSMLDYDVFTDAIRQAIRLHKIDLIIMGTNGATGAKEVIFGSNTIKVIRNINFPVLVVPEKHRFQRIEKILFSTHPRMQPSYSGLKPLMTILKLYKPELDILEIIEEGDALNEDKENTSFSAILREFDIQKFKIKQIPFTFAIETFQQLIPVELHALFIEKEPFIDRLIFGSENSKLTYNTKVPLLIMRP